MLQVELYESEHQIEENSIVVDFVNYKKLIFNIDKGLVDSGVYGDFEYGLDEKDYFYEVYDIDISKIIDSEFIKTLKALPFVVYLSTNSVEETIKRLNSLDLEDVIYSMMKDKVVKKVNALHSEYKEKYLHK